MNIAVPAGKPDSHIDHAVVYRKNDEFSGWPFTSGMWETADGSIVVGFKRSKSLYRSINDVHHDHVNEEEKMEILLMRSSDRGATWDTDNLVQIWERAISEADVLAQGPPNYRDEAPLDFRNKDTLVATGSTPTFGLLNTKTWLRVSTDGGRNWRRPIILPLLGMQASVRDQRHDSARGRPQSSVPDKFEQGWMEPPASGLCLHRWRA